jgi:Ala-tRNA(Pro) deacylase
MLIADFLQARQVEFEPLPHPPAFSAQVRAKYLRLPGREVAKCLLLHGPAGYLLAVLPATHQVDTASLTDTLGGPVRLAAGEEVAAVFRDCEWGVVPPFGTLYGLPTLLDDALPSEAFLVFEGQTHVEAVRLRCADFERLERPRRLVFARRV